MSLAGRGHQQMPKFDGFPGLWVWVTLADGSEFDALLPNDLMLFHPAKGFEIRIDERRGRKLCLLRQAVANVEVLGVRGMGRYPERMPGARAVAATGVKPPSSARSGLPFE
jgi:hypothetical protein